MSEILSITTGHQPEHPTPGDKCMKYIMLHLHLSSFHALLGTVRSGLCTDHRKEASQPTNPGTDASLQKNVVMIISDGGAECSKALSCWNCSFITLLQCPVKGAIQRPHRQKCACHQDMQWMVLKWHVEVMAVVSSKDTSHNTKAVISRKDTLQNALAIVSSKDIPCNATHVLSNKLIPHCTFCGMFFHSLLHLIPVVVTHQHQIW